jgi:oxalate decarboxylase/phosphoglucose isomerase-like protein (cupin superfamily)
LSLSRVAAPGETILNKVTGEQLTFVRTPGSSQGTALELEWWVPEGSRLVALPHRHPDNPEHFELLEGEARYRVGRERRREAAPHRFDVPPNTAHVHPANAGRGPLRLRQWVELEQPDPGLLDGTARYFETVSALASEGRVDGRGLIRNPLQFALTVSELLMPGTYLSFPPPWAQRPPVIALAALARRAGLRAYHEPPPDARGA